MTAFQAVDKGSIPLSRTIMRIRNYFFLVTSLLMVGFIGFVNTKKTSIDTINYSVKPESTAINNDLDTKNAVALSTTSLIIATKTSELVVGDTKKVQEVFKLKVPYFSQQYANSCEASSLRMALAYYHIEILDDMDIVQRFGYNPRKKDTVLNEWDNPQEMFVGNIDIVGSTEGYGVYGKPVEKAAVSYGREAVYITKITAQLLAKELKAGHPIILWGYTSITAPGLHVES
jgi:uncharacterized protein YvpB